MAATGWVLGLALLVAAAPGRADVTPQLRAAQALAAADPQRGLARLRALRQGLPPGSPLVDRLALADAECRVLTDSDAAQAFAVADAALREAGAEPAAPARTPWLRLRACRAGMLVELGRTPEALAELQRLIDPGSAPADPVPRAVALLERGVQRSRSGQVETGQRDLLEACAVLGERSSPADRDLCLAHLANHYRRVGDLDEALRLLLPLREAARRAEARYDASIYTYAIGQVLQEQGHWAAALESMREAARDYEQLGDASGLAYAWGAAAGALVALGRPQEALREATRALELLDPQADPRQYESAVVTRAEVLSALGRQAEALAALDRVGPAVRSRDNPPALAAWLRVRSGVLAGLARWREAYQTLAEARRIEERVQAGRLSKQSAVLRMQFNRQRDADELAALRRLNEQGQRLRQMQALALALSAVLGLLLLAVALRQVRQARRLRTLAATDELTGLPNRRALLARAGQALEDARERRTPVALVMVDVDHFKRVNDTRGHAVGDEVLRHVARVLAGALRTRDALGRVGGEEFVVVMPDTPLADACRVAERMRAALADAPLAAAADGAGPVPVSASFGVAESDGGEPVQAVVSRADQALYEAKRGGRNRVVVAARAGAPPASPPAPAPVPASAPLSAETAPPATAPVGI